MSKRKDADAKAPATAVLVRPPSAAAAASSVKSEAAEPAKIVMPPAATAAPASEASKPADAPQSVAAPQLIELPKPVEMSKPAEAPRPADMPKPIEAALKVLADMKSQAAKPPAAEIKPAIALPPPVAAASESAPPRANRFALLAASVAFAGAVGAMAGALSASIIARPAPVESAAVSDPNSLQGAIAALHADLATLKTNVETTNRRFSDRLERADRAPAMSAVQLKQVLEAIERLERRAQAAPDHTGSTKAQQVAAAPTVVAPPEAPRGTVLEGWTVRHVSRGVAVIQGRRGGLIEVEAGDIVPGVGRIESIRRQDGRWVVVTSKGMIVSSALSPQMMPPGAIPAR